MQNYTVAHADQINAFLSVVLAVVNPFNGKVIAERFDRMLEGDAVVTPVRGSFVVIPFKLYHRVLIIRSFVNCPVFSFLLPGFKPLNIILAENTPTE